MQIIPSREDFLDRLMDENAQKCAHKESVGNTAIHKLEMDKLHTALAMLIPEEQALLQTSFFEEKTERQYAEEIGVYHNSIHVRKIRILNKLKKLLEECCASHSAHLENRYPFTKHIPVDGVGKHQQYARTTSIRNTGSAYIILSVHSESQSDDHWLVNVRLLPTRQ